MKKIIGISGLAGDGKDTVCEMFSAFFKIAGFEFQRISLADKLKEKCAPAMKEMFKIDPTNCPREDKDKIRDYLVFYAKVARIESKGKFWTSIVDEIIKKDNIKPKTNKIYCIPDIRHAYYPEDEAQWVKKNDGILVHVKKYTIESPSPFRIKYSQPINQEEAFNTPIVEKLADFVLELSDCSPLKPSQNITSIQAVSETFRMIIDSIEASKSHSKSLKSGKNA
jgi:hypothetical protein